MAKVVLIDGNSLVYRAFYAVPISMATASGQITNAVHGFTSMLISLWRDHSPDRIVVAFDRPEPTFRHEAIPEYKANRRATPDVLYQQMGLVREVLDVLGIPTAEAPRFEADDVLATLATEGRDVGEDVLVVTGDRDAYQLVEDPHIKLLYNRRGVSDYTVYDEAGIFKRVGVRPADYVALAALRGDVSDNLRGVPGVGEKIAARLVNEWGGLDGIFSSLDELTPRLRGNLGDCEELVRRNERMMLLVRDVALERGLAELAMGEVDIGEVRKLFDFLEFRSLYTRLAEVPGDLFVADSLLDQASTVLEYPEVTVHKDAADAAEALMQLADADLHSPLALATAPGGVEEGLAVVTDSEASQVAFLDGPTLRSDRVRAALATLVGCGSGVPILGGDAPVVSDDSDVAGGGSGVPVPPDDVSERPLAMYDAKSIMRRLMDWGIEMRDPHLDTKLAAYLLDPVSIRYDLEGILRRYAGLEPPPRSGTEGQLNLGESAVSTADETGWAALAVDRLADTLREALAVQRLADLHDDIEVPLVRVLARMEKIGIGVDPEVLRGIRDKLRTDVAAMRAKVLEDAGSDFNVNSPQQLARVLFDDLGLTPSKRTKTGYSTDARSLERIKGDHQIVGHLLEYRELEKLRSTYGEGLLAAVGPQQRIRATFNQTVARTGRLSSDAPNLHNIPVRSERGRMFRTAFVAPPGCRLLVADYDQIELRCIAHLSEDPGLANAFMAGVDVHTATAALVFGIDPDEVGMEERAQAKMVSYGLAYGMEAYGLGQRLNIATFEAAEIMDAYFKAFPAVRLYMTQAVEEARRRGCTETLMGRRLRVPELDSPNSRVRQAGERQAMNAGIQGLAADIFKMALVCLDRELCASGLESRIVLQVHDEIILESPIDEVEAASDLTRSVMLGAFELSPPLEVDLKVVRTWADAKN